MAHDRSFWYILFPPTLDQRLTALLNLFGHRRFHNRSGEGNHVVTLPIFFVFLRPHRLPLFQPFIPVFSSLFPVTSIPHLDLSVIHHLQNLRLFPGGLVGIPDPFNIIFLDHTNSAGGNVPVLAVERQSCRSCMKKRRSYHRVCLWENVEIRPLEAAGFALPYCVISYHLHKAAAGI